MFAIHSMTGVTLWITAALFIQILISIQVNPLIAFGSFVRQILSSPKYAAHFLITLGILFLDRVEQWVSHRLPYHANFTSSIYQLEGNFTGRLQDWLANPTLTGFSSFFYIAVFPSLMITSLFIYTHQRNFKMFYAVCYAIMFNYLVAVPFYLFFPVDEVWSFNPQVRFLITQALPDFETVYRPLSALQNCFPSLHTSISVSMAVIALKSRNFIWSRMAVLSAAFIMFSVLYLGIHWLSDVTAGLILGVAAGKVGVLVSEGKVRLQRLSFSGIYSKRRDFSK